MKFWRILSVSLPLRKAPEGVEYGFYSLPYRKMKDRKMADRMIGRSTLNRGERNARSKRDYGTDGTDGKSSWFTVCSVISFPLPYNSPHLNVKLSLFLCGLWSLKL